LAAAEVVDVGDPELVIEGRSQLQKSAADVRRTKQGHAGWRAGLEVTGVNGGGQCCWTQSEKEQKHHPLVLADRTDSELLQEIPSEFGELKMCLLHQRMQRRVVDKSKPKARANFREALSKLRGKRA
jgi:hypothetical protein